MVRTSTNEPSDDKKETTKKRPTSRKKTIVTGVWPCKINGCNKQFAREADLKRHQRTTKLHSMPGFSCPQCDATFTRTDALRRHQKSRHNGVVIEPSEDSKDYGDEDGSSGSRSKSRSATPSSKGKERVTAPPAVNTRYPVQTTRPGPSSYYRQHTLTSTGPYVPRPPIVDPHYSQIGLPTSATRLNLTTHWGYPHPWPDGTPQQMSYQQMYYSPHYRSNGVSQSLGQLPPPTGTDQQDTPNGAPTGAQQTPPPASCPLHESPDTSKLPTGNTCAPAPPADPAMPAIDPSLNPSDSTTLTEEQVLEITQAAMKAVLEAEAERSSAESRATSASTPTYSEGDRRSSADASDDDRSTSKNASSKDSSHAVHGYGLSLERPEPMEHMLTEDGEPMLNPAELLTQESLASPPPS